MYKHLSLFVAVLAALVLAACSDNDSLDDSAATSDTEVSTSYMAVNIYMTADAATRSSSTVGSEGYATGSEAEYAIDFDNSIFLFYDDEGTFLTYGTITTASGNASTTTTSTSDYAEWTSSAVVILGPTALTPTQVVGVFNDKNTAAYKDLDLEDLQAKLFSESNEVSVSYTENGSTSTATGILMSNAVKYDGSDFSFATEISSDNIKETASEATSNPVSMYVERAKAKVEISVNTSSFTASSTTPTTYTYTLQKETTSDGTTTYADRTFVYYYVDESGDLTSTDGATVGITINGWAVNAYNETGYVIKNYTNDGTELSSDITQDRTETDGSISGALGGKWSSDWYSSLRIFWAVDGNYTAEASASSSSEDSSDDTDSSSEDEDEWELQYYSWSDVEGKGCDDDAAYYYEQTLDPNATTGYDEGQTAYAPTLLVAATVGVNATDATEADGAGDDIFLWYGSVLYSEDAMYAKILSLLVDAGVTIQDNESISSITWETQEAAKGTVTIKSITMSGSTTLTDDNISAINKSDFISSTTTDESGNSTTAYALRMYSAGACYYQVPIQTYISTSSTTDHPYGLVRNTAYSITINSVTGIGAGVPNTSEKLTEIPEEDETGYLACKINVLAWRLSSQTVDL